MNSHPNNEPILEYEPGSTEKESLIEELNRQMSEVIEIPCIINGEKIYTNNTVNQVIPHNHKHTLAKVHLAGKKEIEKGLNIVDLVVLSKLIISKSEVRRTMKNKGIKINNEIIDAPRTIGPINLKPNTEQRAARKIKSPSPIPSLDLIVLKIKLINHKEV